ncbi:hypothetical protein [Roseospira visakhapatnamensis]|uniref:Uncharacterized protein n=1 Tax=Roseospira visakhapatnamensis TaxID=390880 RepID=A0A7W6RFF4_9PROT|nr:hypothetical protein [Roseospira visakhapatnamensis]MBB4267488.1 hypothetical protein [Roseospira visakhapatnamensis]
MFPWYKGLWAFYTLLTLVLTALSYGVSRIVFVPIVAIPDFALPRGFTLGVAFVFAATVVFLLRHGMRLWPELPALLRPSIAKIIVTMIVFLFVPFGNLAFMPLIMGLHVAFFIEDLRTVLSPQDLSDLDRMPRVLIHFGILLLGAAFAYLITTLSWRSSRRRYGAWEIVPLGYLAAYTFTLLVWQRPYM